MADQNRNQQSNQNTSRDMQKQNPTRDESTVQQTRGNQRDSMRDDDIESSSPASGNRMRPESTADDRGRSDRERRNFSSDRESDDLGSELERESDISESDEDDDSRR